MWRGTGENDSPITGNITEFKTENLTAVTQRHSSTLTFNPSAEHNRTNVTCKVSFTNSITTEETVTLNVTYVKEVKITGNTSVKEGETLNLTCSVESFPPSLITWTKLPNKNTQNGTKSDLQEQSGMGTFTIHKVTTKDSGQYICTAKYLNNTLKETIDVAVIYMKKPVITGNTTVEWGHALNLTCSVQSFPPSRITWSILGSNTNLHIEPNTDLQNNTGSATLVIHNVTTKDSGQYICTAQHLNNTLKETVDVAVICMPPYEETYHWDYNVKVEHALNLTCRVEVFLLSNITWTIGGSNTNLHSEPNTDLQNNTGSATLVIYNVTAEHSGQYICTAQHMNNTLNETVDVAVIYMKKPVITGNTTVEWGQTLNLTCSVESFPPSHITWSNLGSNTNLLSEPNTDLQNNTGSATLFIRNVTPEHSGQYICTTEHLNNTLNETVDVTVTLFPKILKHSGCKVQSKVRTCVCISEGLPLPTIRWPLLKNHTEYSFITTVSNHTVNSTVSLSVKHHSNTVVDCVSSNEIGEAKENLTVQTDTSEQEDQSRAVLNIVSWLEVVIAFFIGVLLSAVICCLVKKYHRRKLESCGNLDETLEMVTNQKNPLIDVGQAVEDVEYATIDFSVLKRRSPREAANTQETTEYAEIKKAVKEEREEEGRGGEEEGNEVLDGKEEAMIEEDEEIKQHVPEEDEGEDAAVYSSVKDIMGEICDDPLHLIFLFLVVWLVFCADIIFYTNKNRKVQSGFKGRVSLLEPVVSLNNCSIIINDITESDSGSYQLRVNGLFYGSTDGFTFSPRATVSVKDLTQKPTVMIPPLTEGQQTTLTCTAPGLCSGSRPKITWMWRGTGENDSPITGNITEFKTENLTAVTQRHHSTLTFNLSAEHHGTNVTCKVSFTNSITTEETVTLNVTDVKKPQITGNRTIKEGDTLHLTCKTFPSSLVMWTQVPSNKNLHNKTGIGPQNNTETATIVIHNVTAEHSGQYICTTKHVDTILTISADVTVTLFPKILKHSGCKVQSKVRTCVCISEGLPLPTIRWPLLKNHTEYSFITTVSNHTVNSTVSLSVKDHSNTVVECVSSNEIGEAKENLIVQTDAPEQEDQSTGVLKMVSRLEVLIAFFIGVVLSAVICCLVKKCHRKKQKSFGKLDETLEMVTSQEDPLIDVGQAVEDDQTYYQEAVEDGEGAVAEEKAALDLDGEPKDVEYASIDFSVLKRRSPREAANTQKTTETEYAEIKKEVKEKREEEGRGGEEEENEVLDGKEEAMIEEDEETKQYVPEEDEGEDAEVYSNVKDIMGEI
ncbi:immunoglobulin superfamily member 10-like [Morone saxatilis]|uniref:immunoglobulin superfamily member 10-like n=1 Tax=Morone saxatilis TaxID=34816 RepID=UPI0015E1CFC7|nr:immunoglobulin superfamily member 10-like [Morone saxatilis]